MWKNDETEAVWSIELQINQTLIGVRLRMTSKFSCIARAGLLHFSDISNQIITYPHLSYTSPSSRHFPFFNG